MTSDSEFPSWIKDPMRLLLVHYFDPVTRKVELRMLKWALNNIDEFIKKILPELSDLESKDDNILRTELAVNLRCEAIFTTMQLCEDLAYVFETYKYTTEDPVVVFRAKMRPAAAISNFTNKTDAELLDWLSWPPVIKPAESPRLVTEGLDQFRDFLERVRAFYFENLELYNCNKHGHRVAYMTSPGEDEEPDPVVLYFPPEKDRNTATVRRIDNAAPVLKLADEIVYFCTVSKKNWLSRSRDEHTGQFGLTLPTRKDLDDDVGTTT